MKKTLYVLLCFLYILTGCEHTDPPFTVQRKGFEIKDGRIAFEDRDQLNAFMKSALSKKLSVFRTEIKSLESAGFTSLIPLYDESETDKISIYQQRKLKRMINLTTKPQLLARSKTDDEIEIDDEDEVIFDPYFATILNQEREIQLSDSIYKYTPFGVLIANRLNAGSIDSTASLLTEEAINKIPSGTVYSLTPKIKYFRPIVVEKDQSKWSEAGRAPSPAGFRTCEEVSKSFWEKIFGQSGHCEDYFDDRRRIKTKVWNQNFYLYSSIGVSVKSQKRVLRIWWASEIDELQVGYNFASFKYPKFSGTFPSFAYKYYYEYNGFLVDQYGTYIKNLSGPNSLFKHFPISDPNKSIVKIYISNDLFEYTFNLDGAKINGYTEAAFKAAYDKLKQYGTDLNSKGAVIINYDNLNPAQSEVYFTHTNWSKNTTNDNSIVEVFDWNTGQIGFKIKGGAFSPDVNFNSRSYDKAKILSYGLGRRGSDWKGSNIYFIDSK